MLELEVSKQLTIKDSKGSYNRCQLARAVAYWQDYLQALNDDRPVGLWYGWSSTSFQTIALLLAIIDSGRSYYKFSSTDEAKKVKIPDIGTLSHTFSVGLENSVYADTSKIYGVTSVYADSAEHRELSLNYHRKHPLKIKFHADSYRYNSTSGTTGLPKAVKVSLLNDGQSVLCAMEQYFSEDDYCVFAHNMLHIGVHTTAIFPAVFKARVLSLIDVLSYPEEVVNATHIQYFYTMLNECVLPKGLNVRICTTGGDYLKPQLVNTLLDAGVKEIIDIYGLTEAPPPLAIRSIKSVNDLSKPFNWVATDYSCRTDEADQLHVQNSQGDERRTGDRCFYNTESKELFYDGRLSIFNTIRFKGVWTPTTEVTRALAEESGLVNYFLDTAVEPPNFPKLFVTPREAVAAQHYIGSSGLTVELKITDNIPTNDGIKTTR